MYYHQSFCKWYNRQVNVVTIVKDNDNVNRINTWSIKSMWEPYNNPLDLWVDTHCILSHNWWVHFLFGNTQLASWVICACSFWHSLAEPLGLWSDCNAGCEFRRCILCSWKQQTHRMRFSLFSCPQGCFIFGDFCLIKALSISLVKMC